MELDAEREQDREKDPHPQRDDAEIEFGGKGKERKGKERNGFDLAATVSDGSFAGRVFIESGTGVGITGLRPPLV